MRLSAVVTLQAYWRGYLVRQLYCDELLQRKKMRQKIYKAALLLQASWRGFSTRRKFYPILEARRIWRKERGRQEEIIRNRNATMLQAHWRGYRIRCIHEPTLLALRKKRVKEMKEEKSRKCNLFATLLQSLWRGYVVRKTYRPVLIKRMEESRKEIQHRRQNAAVRLQACWRGHCVRRRVMQLLLEQRNERRVLEKQQKAVITLQAHWRGHACRVKHTLQQCQLQQAHNTMEGTSPSLKSEACNDLDTLCMTSNSSGKLTVTKRLESALRFRSQAAVVLSENEICTLDSGHRQNALQSAMIHKCEGATALALSHGEHSYSIDDEKEKLKVATCPKANTHEEDIFQQSVLTRSSARTYLDSEKVGGRSLSFIVCVMFAHQTKS